jgi:hypothetical protein
MKSVCEIDKETDIDRDRDGDRETEKNEWNKLLKSLEDKRMKERYKTCEKE